LNNKQVKWLIYTVLVGLIPIFLRLMIYFVTDGSISIFSASDFIAFGIVLLFNIMRLGTLIQED